MFLKIKKLKKGSALLLTLFLMTSIIVISMGGASLALSGIRMSGIQSQSVKAYYAAEAGAEELLYKVRQSREIDLSLNIGDIAIEETSLDSNSNYFVIFTKKALEYPVGENIFISIGTFLNTRRSVDIIF